PSGPVPQDRADRPPRSRRRATCARATRPTGPSTPRRGTTAGPGSPPRSARAGRRRTGRAAPAGRAARSRRPPPSGSRWSGGSAPQRRCRTSRHSARPRREALRPSRLPGRRGRPRLLAQPETLHLAGGGARQRVEELDLPGVLVGRDLVLDVVLELLTQHLLALLAPEARQPASGDDIRLDHVPALLARGGDDGDLHHVRVGDQHLLDLGARDVVARGDDHVVRARLVPVVAVLVAD